HWGRDDHPRRDEFRPAAPRGRVAEFFKIDRLLPDGRRGGPHPTQTLALHATRGAVRAKAACEAQAPIPVPGKVRQEKRRGPGTGSGRIGSTAKNFSCPRRTPAISVATKRRGGSPASDRRTARLRQVCSVRDDLRIC